MRFLFSSAVALIGLSQTLPTFSVEIGEPPNPFLSCYRINVKNEGFLPAFHVKYTIKSIDVEKVGSLGEKEIELEYSRVAETLKRNKTSSEILCVGIPGTFDKPFVQRRNRISVIVRYRILPFLSPSLEDEFFFTSWPNDDGTVNWKPAQLSEEPGRVQE